MFTVVYSSENAEFLQLRALLETHNIDFEVKEVSIPRLYAMGYRKSPQIFRYGHHVGNFHEFVAEIERSN